MVKFKKVDRDNDLTIIASSTKVIGDLNSKGDIRVEGEIEGFIQTTQKVYVDKNAQLHGNVLAEEAIIEGEVIGDIKTGRL